MILLYVSNILFKMKEVTIEKILIAKIGHPQFNGAMTSLSGQI